MTDLITPEEFTAAMTARWHDLGNVSSTKLQALWSTMACTFNRAATDSDKPNSPWLVLEPPTGSGKTQGLCVYAAMALAEVASTGSDKPTGILIVTRLIDQADQIASTIRELAGLAPDGVTRVVAKHSKNSTTVDQMKAAQVLVITHAAYTNALEGLVKDTHAGSRWTDYVVWQHGRRKLTVIDEALAGVVEEYKVTAESIRHALSFIDWRLEDRFKPQVTALKETLAVLDTLARAGQSADSDDDDDTADTVPHHRASRVVWQADISDNRGAAPAVANMDGLRDAMRGLPFGSKHDMEARLKVANRVDDTLESVETILTKWAYYNRRGNDDQFNASQLLIPPGLPGPVILDGTASQNFLWELLEHRAEIVPTVSGARIYANVNLHVLHSLGTGKNAMRDHGLRRVPQLLTHLSEHLPHDRKVLLVVHKDNVHRAKNWAHPFAKYDVANWGAIDGRNDWNDYDTVVLFGLNHRPTTWANNVFFALRGGPPTSNDWFTNPTWRDYPNVRKEMEVRQLAVDAIQAINRVRCRRVADADGGCDPTDVYAILPTGERGTAILDCLKEEMPGAVVGEWNYTLDGATSRSIRRGSCHEPLLALVDNRPAGELSMSYLRKELGLDERRLRNLRETLRDPGHALNKALTGRGVSYVTDGKGRKARSYLLKAG